MCLSFQDWTLTIVTITLALIGGGGLGALLCLFLNWCMGIDPAAEPTQVAAPKQNATAAKIEQTAGVKTGLNTVDEAKKVPPAKSAAPPRKKSMKPKAEGKALGKDKGMKYFSSSAAPKKKEVKIVEEAEPEEKNTEVEEGGKDAGENQEGADSAPTPSLKAKGKKKYF